MKLTGWSILLVSAAARLLSAVHNASTVSLVPIVHDVKRTLKFDDEADASDVSMPPADETDGSGFVESASDAEDDTATDWDTFWAHKPTRDMIRTLSSQEVESNKTDLAVARLDEWMLKFMAFTRRRYPQFGELLEIVWTLGDLEEATSLVTTSVLSSDANLWGASALMSVIDVSKPAGKVFASSRPRCSMPSEPLRAPCPRASKLLSASPSCSRIVTRAMRRLTTSSLRPSSTSSSAKTRTPSASRSA